MSSKSELVESKITETRAGIIRAREKIAQLKETIVSEISSLLPVYLDGQIAEFVGINHSTLEVMTEEQLQRLKTTIKRTIPIAVSQMTSRLGYSEDWFSCKEQTQYSCASSPLWKNVESVDEPVFKVLKQAGFNVGKWRLAAQAWVSCVKQRTGSKWERLNDAS